MVTVRISPSGPGKLDYTFECPSAGAWKRKCWKSAAKPPRSLRVIATWRSLEHGAGDAPSGAFALLSAAGALELSPERFKDFWKD
jgi:hypothetical protein